MSDELVSHLKGDRERFESQATKYRQINARLKKLLEEKDAQIAQYQERDAAAQEIADAYEALESENGELKQRLDAGPDEWRTKYEETQKQLSERDHRDAWRDAIGAELQEKVTPDKLWREMGYTPEGAPDPAAIRRMAAEAREAAPYLFKPAGETPAARPGDRAATARQPLDEGLPGGRGSRDTAPAKLRVRRSDLADPELALGLQPRIAEALKGPGVEFVD